MGTIGIAAGEYGYDFSYSFPPPQIMRQAGYSFAVGYFSTNPDKNLTPARIAALANAGVAILAVWETYQTRPNGGAAAGDVDGKLAAKMADQLGYPLDLPILTAVDFNVDTPAELAAGVAYVSAFRAALGQPAGVYGDSDIIRATAHLTELRWLMGSTSFSDSAAVSGADPLFHVRQYAGYTRGPLGKLVPGVAAGAYDDNKALQPFSAWAPWVVAPPQRPDVVRPPGPAITIPAIAQQEEFTLLANTPARFWRARGYANVVATDYVSGVASLAIAGNSPGFDQAAVIVIDPDPDRPNELHPVMAQLYGLAGITAPKPNAG